MFAATDANSICSSEMFASADATWSLTAEDSVLLLVCFESLQAVIAKLDAMANAKNVLFNFMLFSYYILEVC